MTAAKNTSSAGKSAKKKASPKINQAFDPLAFPDGEVGQFDWNYETVYIGGIPQASGEGGAL